jgi:hypothetical protein
MRTRCDRQERDSPNGYERFRLRPSPSHRPKPRCGRFRPVFGNAPAGVCAPCAHALCESPGAVPRIARCAATAGIAALSYQSKRSTLGCRGRHEACVGRGIVSHNFPPRSLHVRSSLEVALHVFGHRCGVAGVVSCPRQEPAHPANGEHPGRPLSTALAAQVGSTHLREQRRDVRHPLYE